jgi:hypothetical protein
MHGSPSAAVTADQPTVSTPVPLDAGHVRKQRNREGTPVMNQTITRRRLARIRTVAMQPMSLRREVVRQEVAFDRQLNRVQPFTLLSVPR